jgi:hypothetical protein
MRTIANVAICVLLITVWAARPAQAQKDRGNPLVGSPLFWKTEDVVDVYVRAISRYYNLTEKQTEYTQKFMTQRIKRFMDQYETDVRGMMHELAEYQLNRQLPPAEMAKEFAGRATPIVEAIREEIMDGTMTWRRILNEDQKKIHDRDLKILENEFKRYNTALDRWSRGEVTDTDLPGFRGRGTGPIIIQKPEDAWRSYVRAFKRNYYLDRSQQEVADSILRELIQEATKYREANKEAFAQLNAALDAFSSAPRTSDKEERKQRQQEFRKLYQRKEALEQKISVDMFNRLKAQLEKIPTVDQRKQREEHLNRLRELVNSHRRGPQTKPAAAPTTQPTTSPTTAPTAAG